MQKTSLSAVALSFAVLAFVNPVRAADLVQLPVEDYAVDNGWSFSITPYFWMAGMKGQIGVAGRDPASVSLSFGNIFDAIDWSPPPVMFTGEARNGRYALFTDFFYLGTEADGTLPFGRRSVNLDMNNIIWSFGGSYRVVDNGTATLDLLAGGRLWYVDTDIVLTGPLNVLHAGGSKTWVDPIVGVSGSIDLGKGFKLRGEADIGGFGLGADIDWQVVGTLEYQFKQSFALEVGYRYLDVDYDKDGFVFDVAMQGPIIGASFRF